MLLPSQDQYPPLLPMNLLCPNILPNEPKTLASFGPFDGPESPRQYTGCLPHRLWGNSAWEENGIVLMSSFQATCVDLGMDLVFVWQLECVVRRIWLSFRDLKGADIARIKLCAPTFLLDAEA